MSIRGNTSALFNTQTIWAPQGAISGQTAGNQNAGSGTVFTGTNDTGVPNNGDIDAACGLARAERAGGVAG